jgi:glycosyltransferase involved in cell wall biosynthesis
MHIGLIAPPFLPVPPIRYGGTELFVAQLADGLQRRGHDVTVYANGDSTVACPVKWLYRHAEWPVTDPTSAQLKNADHTAWALHEATRTCDIVHLNDVIGAPFTRFIDVPVVLTLHHPYEPALSAVYMRYPAIDYVAISEAQARREPMPRTRVVHHGLAVDDYRFSREKEEYVVFLGRMAPCKGPHLAIQAARRVGLPLKLAGEVQPVFREYWEREVLPHIDGEDVQFVGEADWAMKNRLLSNARALLFPIQWEEPFGLVMIEAMACGTPVLAFAGGAVSEIVRDGVSGWICRDVAEMSRRAAEPQISPDSCQAWVRQMFSRDRMVENYLQVYARALHAGSNLATSS